MPGGITGNYVGETLLAIRAHQGDVRVDWSASTNDKFFGRYSFALYEDRRDEQPFPLVFCRRATISRSTTSASTGTACSARR